MTTDAKWEHVSHPYEDGEPAETFAEYEDWLSPETDWQPNDSRQEAPDDPARAREARA